MEQLNQQEELLVWMRPAALPIFRKLYGRIETDLEANEVIKVEIQNNYNTYSFKGHKKLVISTTTWIGGKNDFLGKVYIVIGGVCLLIAIAFIITYLVKPRCVIFHSSFLCTNASLRKLILKLINMCMHSLYI